MACPRAKSAGRCDRAALAWRSAVTKSLDTGAQNFVAWPGPPVARKNLDFAVTVVTGSLDPASDTTDVDNAIAHHAAVIEQIARRHEPVANVKSDQTRAARA